MDIRKVLHIINIVLEDNTQYELQNDLQNMLNFLNNNQIDDFNAAKERLFSNIENSRAANFVRSDIKVLDGLGMRKFFSIDLIDTTEEALSANQYEFIQKLQSLCSERSEKMNALLNLKNNIEDLGVKDTVPREKYQIVLSLPERYGDMNQLTGVIDDMNKFLSAINALSERKEAFKIVSADDGCLEFLIECSEYLAGYFSSVLDCALKVYASVKMFNDGKKVYENYSEKRRKVMDDTAKEEMEERKDKIVEELIKTIAPKSGEQQSSVRTLFKKIIKHIESGVSVEIKTPEIEEPKIGEGDSKQEKDQKKKLIQSYKTKEKIDVVNRNIYVTLQKGDFNLYLPENSDDNAGSEGEETEREEENKTSV